MNINMLDETEDMHSVGIIHIAQQKNAQVQNRTSVNNPLWL